MEASYWASLGWSLLLAIMVYFIIRVVCNTIKTERKRKVFKLEMKSGDKAYFPVASGGVYGEILEVNEDDVKIVVTIPKSRVYPDK
jgi:preprotein translocase subunit YajC